MFDNLPGLPVHVVPPDLLVWKMKTILIVGEMSLWTEIIVPMPVLMMDLFKITVVVPSTTAGFIPS